MKKLLSLILAILMVVPSLVSVSYAAETTVLEDIVVGVNEHYIGSGYQKKISDAFEQYLADLGYSCNIEYRTLGNSSTTAAQLGKLINAAGDIDFVLAAGLNIDSTAGVKIIAKKLHKSNYNSDGGRYGALLTDKFAARLLYNFLTGDCHHLYDNACDATCNVCAATRTPSAHAYSSASDTTCNSCGKTRTVTKLDDIVIGVNQHYIGSGYQKKISDAFAAYAIAQGYVFNIEYRTLGNSSTTAAQLGKLVNAAGDIDLVLAAGANIDSTAGVKILAKKLHKSTYNADGKRYGALLTDTTGAAIFYYFLTGGCYHVYSNACDASCNACGATRTASAHAYDNACDATCNSCGAKRTVPAHVYTDSSDATCNVCGFEREVVVHVYDNACDSTCNDCGATRTPSAHVYSNACDTSCNVCGATRTASAHVYSNAWDPSCNVCGATRTASAHVYSGACDASCNVCGATRTASAHTYDNACDASCNVCGTTRTASAHVYDNACDASCNVCGAARTVGAHVYDNACDAACNSCGATRTPAAHVYSNACDASCNVCGATRTASAHVYTNACDASCNVCGATRTVADHVYDNDKDAFCNICDHERSINNFEKIVVGINQHYIGSGYQTKIADAFAAYMESKGYNCEIEYRVLGNSSTTAAQLGKLINSAGDIDLVLAAGANINSTAGVNILVKKLHKSTYNSDGKRYGALLTDKPAAAIFYYFLTGGCYHLYDNACDADCNVCGATRTPSAHAYDNACDKSCNTCGAVRTVPAHVFSNACDTTCNSCGIKRVASAHVYDNACDASCNVCGVERTVADHVYDNDEDDNCNVCGKDREPCTHAYTNDADAICNICGEERMVVIVAINARRIGSGYANTIKADFEEYAAEMGIEISVVYRNLGNSSTTAAQLGTLVKAEGDIDVVLAAGNNVDWSDGSALTIAEKALHIPNYNADGARYAARLTDSEAAVIFYDFVTGGCKMSPDRSKTQTLNILFIGNSFTFYNEMPEKYFASICKEGGYKVNVTSITNGGHYLYEYADENDTYGAKVKSALENNKYDIVILQEQSRGAITNNERFNNAVRELAAMVKANGAELYLYSTWGYKAGYSKLSSCGGTTAAMEMKLRAAYTAIAEEVGAKVVYAGVAMLDIYKNTSINVYQSDMFHPSASGSLLVAYTFYATLFGEDPRALTYTAGLSASNVAKLRKAAFEAAFYAHPVTE